MTSEGQLLSVFQPRLRGHVSTERGARDHPGVMHVRLWCEKLFQRAVRSVKSFSSQKSSGVFLGRRALIESVNSSAQSMPTDNNIGMMYSMGAASVFDAIDKSCVVGE